MMNLCKKEGRRPAFFKNKPFQEPRSRGGGVSKLAFFLLFSLIFILNGCNDGKKSGTAESSGCMEKLREVSAPLVIDENCAGERVVLIRSVVGRDTLEKFFVLRDSVARAVAKPLPPGLSQAMVLSYPVGKVAVLSSAQIGFMIRLGLEDRIVAVGSRKYIADSVLYGRVVEGRVAELIPDGMEVDYERLMALKPDLVMTYATGGSQDDYYRMEKLGLPAMLTSEWQADSPLAKARWIRLFGALFGVEPAADSIDSANASAYGALACSPVRGSLATESASLPKDDCPRVLAGISYGGTWYAPGGKSYTANLIKDAGGCYLWASDTTREIRLSIEDVMALADSADLWINPGMYGTPEDILTAEPRAAYIKAFRNKKVFQYDGRKGPEGGNDFFEGAVARPAEVLRNLQDQWGFTAESLPCLISDQPKKPVFADSSFNWYHNIF